jgi:N-acetylglucosamine kinase-like BadF-type ATPase
MPADAAVALLAVDGGNSKTDVVLLSPAGEVLGRARGEGSNHQFSGIEPAMDALEATVSAALASAGLDAAARPVAPLGCYCLAGYDLDVDARNLSAAVAARGFTTEDRLENDTMAVVRAGFTGSWGVGVVCGTGLNCAGIGQDGSTVRFASLGELSGDFTPGGAWLGTRALGLALRVGDGRGAPTALASAVPAHFALSSPEEVLEAVYTGSIGYNRLFELAEVLLGCAADGDEVARGAADQLADEVAAMVGACIVRLGAAASDVEVVLGGGIFDTRDEGFMERVHAGVRSSAPEAVLRRLGAPPVVGAALLGLDALGADADALARARAALSGAP